uniref:NR LBD domain-containing protein n=1 Tax=Caenorhabditis tropicalis TaxID=1561998 RepID=A0A1I7TEB7_9PELO
MSRVWNRKSELPLRIDLVQPKRNDNKLPKYVLESRKEGIREVVRGYITSAYSNPVEAKKEEMEEEEEEDTVEGGYSTILNVKYEDLLMYYVEEIKNSVENRHVEMEEQTPYHQFLSTKKRTDQLALDICTTCPGTDLLESHDIGILYRYCSFASLWMDSAWITAGRNEFHVDEEISEDPLSQFIHQFQSTITCQLARLKLDLFEYAALKAFCIWKLAIMDSTLTLKIVAGEQYLGVTSALSTYYQNSKNMEPFEMATRLADITLLIAPIFNIYREMLKLYHNLQIEDCLVEE